MAQKHMAASSVRELGDVVAEAHQKLLKLVLSGGPYKKGQIEFIDKANGQLTMASLQLITNSVGISLRGLEQSVTSLKQITKDARDAVDDIEDVQQGIAYLALFASFAAAVAMGDVKAIVKSGALVGKQIGKEFV